MNTKGIKFLAVLAVLVMAFAAFAVITSDTKQIDAADVTTEAEFNAAVSVSNFNVKLSNDIVISGSATAIVNDGTIDLNGHTITGKKDNAIWVKQGTVSIVGTGTLTNDYAKSSSNIVVYVGSGSQDNVAKVTIGSNVSVTNTAGYGVVAAGANLSDDFDQVVEIHGSVEAKSFAVSGNGSSKNGSTKITIFEGAQVTSTDSPAIYHPQAGTLIVNGELTGTSGIEIKSGNVIVEVGSEAVITATGTESHVEYNNGSSTDGYAIAVVENSNYKGSPTFVMNAGTIYGDVALVADNVVEDGKKGSITISGGSIIGKVVTVPTNDYIRNGKTGEIEERKDPIGVNEPKGTITVTGGYIQEMDITSGATTKLEGGEFGTLSVSDNIEISADKAVTVDLELNTTGNSLIYLEKADGSSTTTGATIALASGAVIDATVYSEVDANNSSAPIPAYLNFQAGNGGVNIVSGSVEISGTLSAEEIEAEIAAAGDAGIIFVNLTVTGGTLSIDNNVTISKNFTVDSDAKVISSAGFKMADDSVIYNSGRIDIDNIDGDKKKYTIYATEDAVTNVDNQSIEPDGILTNITVTVTGNGTVKINGMNEITSTDAIGKTMEVVFLKSSSTLTFLYSGAFLDDYSAMIPEPYDIEGLSDPIITQGGQCVKYDITSSVVFGDDAAFVINFVDTSEITIVDEDGTEVTEAEVVITDDAGFDHEEGTNIWTVPVGSTIILSSADETKYYEFEVDGEVLVLDAYVVEDDAVTVTAIELVAITVTAEDEDGNAIEALITLNGIEYEVPEEGVTVAYRDGATVMLTLEHMIGYTAASFTYNTVETTDVTEGEEYELTIAVGGTTLELVYTAQAAADYTVELSKDSALTKEQIGDADVVTVTYKDSETETPITTTLALGEKIEDAIDVKVEALTLVGFEKYAGTATAEGGKITVSYALRPVLTIDDSAITDDITILVNGEEYTDPVCDDVPLTIQIVLDGYNVTAVTYVLGDAEPVTKYTDKFTLEKQNANKTLKITEVSKTEGSYNIAIVPISEATITVSQGVAKADTTIIVYLNVTDPRFVASEDSVVVMTKSGDLVEVTYDEENKYYTFEMPGSDVTVTAVLEQIYYSVVVDDDIEDGTITASPALIDASDLPATVTLTIKPAEGYELSYLTVTDSLGTEIEYVLKNNKATFIVNEENADDFYVTAGFVKVSKAIYTDRQEYIITYAGESTPFAIELVNDNLVSIDLKDCTITSSDSTVVKATRASSVDEWTFTAEKAGSAKLTIRYGNLTTTATVFVYNTIGELKEGISVDQPLNGAWKIADAADGFKVNAGVTLTLSENASLDLSGKTLTVDGKLVISKGANIYNGIIDIAVDAVIDNSGFIGMDDGILVINHNYDEDGKYVEQYGRAYLRDVSGISFEAVEVDSIIQNGYEYVMTLSGIGSGYTVFSTVAGTFYTDGLTLSGVAVSFSSIVINEDSVFVLAEDSSANVVDFTLLEGAEIDLNGEINLSIVTALTGTQPVDAKVDTYTETHVSIDNLSGIELSSYKVRYSLVMNDETYYFYQMVLDMSGDVKIVDASKEDADLAITSDAALLHRLVGVTVTGELILPKELSYNSIVTIDNAKLFVTGEVKLSGDDSFTALTNVEGTEYIASEVAYITSFDSAMAMIAKADDKQIYVFGDATLKTDVPAECVIQMQDGTLTIDEDATVTVNSKADITISSTEKKIVVDGVIILKDGYNSYILESELTGYNVKTENSDGSVEYSSLKAALASGKTEITIVGNAVLDDRTTIADGVKITIPKNASLTISDDFTLSKGASIEVQKDGSLTIAGTELEPIDATISGTIDALKGSSVSIANTEVTVDGELILQNGSTFVYENNDLNGATVAVTIDKKSVRYITSLDKAVTLADLYADKENVVVSVYGKANGSTLMLADKVSIVFTSDAKSKADIVLGTESVVTINSGAQFTGTVTGFDGVEGATKATVVTLKDAGNVIIGIESKEKDVVSYWTDIGMYSLTGKIEGEVTITSGTIYLMDSLVSNSDDAVSKLTVDSDAVMIIDDDATLAAVKGVSVKGTMYVDETGTLTAGDMSVSGSLLVNKDGKVAITKMTLTGILTIDDNATVTVSDSLTVGTKAKALSANAAIIGKIDIVSGFIKVYKNGDVSAALINWDKATESSDAVSTKFTIDDMDYMTIYALKKKVLVDDIVSKEKWEITGIQNDLLKDPANWYSGTTAAKGKYIGEYASFVTKSVAATVTGNVAIGTGLTVFIDGKNQYPSKEVVLNIGTHTVSYEISAGYIADKVTVTFNGKTVPVTASGMTFTITADMATFDLNVTGAVEPEPEPTPTPEEQSEWTVTTILLCVLVVLIAIMAVIVALRLNRN